MSVLVNGSRQTTIDALDRGLQYGDGLFETIRIRRGRPRLLTLHLERLAEGCNRLRLPPPDEGQLRQEITAVSAEPESVVKVIVTRGVGDRGYRPSLRPTPTRIVATSALPDRPAECYSKGARLRTCRVRLSPNPALAGLKHLCRLEQVLARAEWQDESIAEGLMLDDQGLVVCGTQSNVFALAGGELLTPRVDRCGVAGVMRRAVLQWAARNALVARETSLRPEELMAASEVFLTNALIGAWPACELDGQALARGTMAAEFNRWLDPD
jgi:4-amino-4-deoxychorismate lyase